MISGASRSPLKKRSKGLKTNIEIHGDFEVYFIKSLYYDTPRCNQTKGADSWHFLIREFPGAILPIKWSVAQVSPSRVSQRAVFRPSYLNHLAAMVGGSGPRAPPYPP